MVKCSLFVVCLWFVVVSCWLLLFFVLLLICVLFVVDYCLLFVVFCSLAVVR